MMRRSHDMRWKNLPIPGQDIDTGAVVADAVQNSPSYLRKQKHS